MQSPKFAAKKKDLEQVINPFRLKATWKTKVRESLRRQSVPDVLEHLDFHIRLDAMCASIAAEVCSGGYIPQPSARLLVEKSKGLCRQVVLPAVKDALVLQTLSDALWAEIRGKAPSQNAYFAPEDHGFSNVKGHSTEYGAINAWLKFQEAIFGFAKTRRYVVVTDIANYYDFISYDHLRNILADLALVREHALDLLIYSLSWMLWQPDYMPRIPVGLPQIHLDAPRLLAHSFLFEIDDLLKKYPNIDFARFMDDIDIGVDTIAEARAVLRDLDLALQTRQVRLNSGKTKILNEVEARKHFKIAENSVLDLVSDRIDAAKGNAAQTTKNAIIIQKLIARWEKNGNFRTGNGDKIFKRLINFARQTKTKLTAGRIANVVQDYPALRSAILTYWQHHQSPDAMLAELISPILTNEAVDDAYLIDLVTALVAARLPDAKPTLDRIDELVQAINPKKPWGYFALLWLLSKYGDSDSVMKLIESSGSLWMTQEQLARLTAGMFPRFASSPSQAKFEAIILRSGSRSAREVLQFHRHLFRGTHGYTSIKNFVMAPNRSLPNRISHPKFLMISTLLRNVDIDPSATANIRATHLRALSDDFYKKIAQ